MQAPHQLGKLLPGAGRTSSDQHGHVEGLHEAHCFSVALDAEVEAAQAIACQRVSTCIACTSAARQCHSSVWGWCFHSQHGWLLYARHGPWLHPMASSGLWCQRARYQIRALQV